MRPMSGVRKNEPCGCLNAWAPLRSPSSRIRGPLGELGSVTAADGGDSNHISRDTGAGERRREDLPPSLDGVGYRRFPLRVEVDLEC